MDAVPIYFKSTLYLTDVRSLNKRAAVVCLGKQKRQTGRQTRQADRKSGTERGEGENNKDKALSHNSQSLNFLVL